MFFLFATVTGGFGAVSFKHILLFSLSGAVGLVGADMFLLKAFVHMGAARTMLLYTFQPLIVGTLSYFVFGQTVDPVKFFSIIFFVICVFIFSLENYKTTAKWSFTPALLTACAIICDACSTIITRIAFDASGVRAIEGNFYRTLGAMLIFIVMCVFSKAHFWATLKKLSKKELAMMSFGVFWGGMCLVFYLAAVKVANLASLSGTIITGVIFTALFECVWQRKWPSKYLWASFIFFAAGMYLLLFAGS